MECFYHPSGLSSVGGTKIKPMWIAACTFSVIPAKRGGGIPSLIRCISLHLKFLRYSSWTSKFGSYAEFHGNTTNDWWYNLYHMVRNGHYIWDQWDYKLSPMVIFYCEPIYGAAVKETIFVERLLYVWSNLVFKGKKIIIHGMLNLGIVSNSKWLQTSSTP